MQTIIFFAIQITLNLANESKIIINNIDLKDFDNHSYLARSYGYTGKSLGYSIKNFNSDAPHKLYKNILEGQKLKS